MMQQDEPGDYVIATGQSHSVQEFLCAAFEYADLDWKKYVEIDPRYYRPAEVNDLIGDATKAKTELGWQATTHFSELTRVLVDADIKLLDTQLARGEEFVGQNSLA